MPFLRRYAPVAVSALAACALLLSCRPEPERGWQPLWRSSWQLLQAHELWLHGVPLDGGRSWETAAGEPRHFRARLANGSEEPREVVLDDPSDGHRWSLQPGEDLSIDVVLPPGPHRIEGGAGVVLGEPRLGLPLERPRLLVLVLADTLRADHVEPGLTPGILDAFADGRRWTDATANAPWTLPSVASFFTSRSPLDLALPEGDVVGVPRGVPTWAERLEAAGFSGGAAVANYSIHAQNGFATGFASYRVPPGGPGPKQRDVSWVVAEGRRFLAAHRGEDAFLYLHLMDPHEPFRDHGGGLPEPPPMTPLGLRQRTATAAERELIRRLYRGEVRHLDRGLAPLLAELPPEATVAFVADHGEALGEHGVWGHALTLYQEVVAVPLLLRGPGVEPGTVDDPVQLLDLAPTLLRAVGVEPAAGMEGRSLLTPREPTERQRPILTTTFAAGPLRWAWRDRGLKAVWRGAPQAAGAPGARAHREREALPAGLFVHRLPGNEEDAVPAPAELGLRVARLFARSAGGVVPGVTVLVAGVSGPAEVAFDASGDLEPVQVWGAAEVQVERQGSRWTIRTADAYPLAGVAFRAPPGVVVTPVAGAVPWPGRSTGRSARAGGDDAPPAFDDPGAYLWWNRPRTLEISGQEETEKRLRALGYL